MRKLIPFLLLSVLGASALADSNSGGPSGGGALPTISNSNLAFGSITTPMTGTAATPFSGTIGTGQAGLRFYATAIACQNSSTTGTMVQVLDGASTVIGTLAAGPSYSGDDRQNYLPTFVTSVGNALEVKNVTGSASVTCNVAGYFSAG